MNSGLIAFVLTIGDYAFDEDLIALTRSDRQPRMRIYRVPEPIVVLGRGSKPEVEIDASSCEADGVRVERRSGGGCAVVLDSGNLIVSLTVPTSGLGGNRSRFRTISEWLIRGLERCAIAGVTTDGISDLVLNDRKISGSCIHQWHDLVYYSATLLVTADLGLMMRYLPHPPREPDYRRRRSHADFRTRLVDEVPALRAIGESVDPCEWLSQRLASELRLSDLIFG